MKNMKSFIGLLGVVTLTGLSATTLIACSPNSKTQATDLNNVIKNKNLGVITIIDKKPSKVELLREIKVQNPDTAKNLTENDFVIKETKTINANNVTKKIIITGVGKYQNNVILTYEKDTRTELSDVIVELKLEKIIMQDLIPSKVELLQGIQAKNPDTAKNLKVIDFDFKTTPTGTEATIIGIGDYKGDMTLTYARETDLGKYIVKTKLGIIVMQDLIPTKVELLREIKVQNPDTAKNLKVIDFDFKTTPTGTEATIIGIGVYDNLVTLTYEKYTRTELSDVIVKNQLGKIVMTSIVPTKVELLREIKVQNPDTAKNLTENDFDLNTDGPQTATITGTGDYKGDVTLTYDKETRVDISKITELTGLNIKADANFTYDTLWKKIIENANELEYLQYNAYDTFMYASNDPKDTTSIKNNKQAATTIYIVFQVNKEDGVNCYGTTIRLAVTLT